MRLVPVMTLLDRKQGSKQPNRVSVLQAPKNRPGIPPTSYSDLRMRTTFRNSAHYRTSAVTIPCKDLHRTIKCQVVIANRKRSRHTKRFNNRILFSRAAKSKTTGLAGDSWSCLFVAYWSYAPPGSGSRPRFHAMLNKQRVYSICYFVLQVYSTDETHFG